MRDFEHLTPGTIAAALSALDERWQTRLLAGGTDLLPEMKAGIVQPERVINLKPLGALKAIQHDRRNGLRLGALTTLKEIAGHSFIRDRYPALSGAASLAASPQLRNVATLGGNLCQSSRCWYYRGDFNCHLRGGDICSAELGENPYHAILGGGPCYTVHPSDPATALLALDATVRLVGAESERMVPIEQFFTRPQPGHWRLNDVASDEIVTDVRIPARSAGQSVFLKAMERSVWDFALVSVALWVRMDGYVVREARLVLGGVAPVPWQAHEAETVLLGAPADTATAHAAAEAALAHAQPLKDNAYKIDLAATLIRRAVLSLAPKP